MAWESIHFVEKKNTSITWIYHHLSINFLKFSVGVVYRFEHCTCMSMCGCAYLCMSTWMQGVCFTLYFFFTILQLNFWDRISSLNIAVIISLQWMTIGLFLSRSLPPTCPPGHRHELSLSTFTMALGVWTQLPVLVQQAPYPLSYISCPCLTCFQCF